MMCGSLTHVSVWKTKQSIRGLKLTPTTTEIVQLQEEIEFDVTYLTGPANVIYAFDYGDGAGRTPVNASDMMTKSYRQPGTYVVSAYGNDVDGTPDMVKHE